MPSRPLKIAYITAGAAGMFCGSCMHDNALARALIRAGQDVTLVPLYTPIRTDEEVVAIDRVFFGGINVYLQQRWSLFRWLPRWADRWLDSPWLIRLATRCGIQTQARELGAMAVSMLQGNEGRQRKEVADLAAWLAEELQPDIVNFSNMLMAGSIPEIKRRRAVPVTVTLQGDDIFLNDLVEPYKTSALAEIRRLDASVDGYIVNSQYYADFMAKLLHLPREKFQIVPLGIDTHDFLNWPAGETPRPPTIGYLARLAPEKGLHLLVEAFLLLKQMPGLEDAQLLLAGWLGAQHQAYADEQFQKLRDAGYEGDFRYLGAVDRRQKLEFLRSIDVLSVPTTYHEPKGLFVLEAQAAGVPVVEPEHGAFPELLESTEGGVLVPPGDPSALAEALALLLRDSDQRRRLGAAGRRAVLTQRSETVMARQTLEVLQPLVSRMLPTPASS